MILTEKEARHRVCCGPYAIACMMEKAVDIKCCASECMAWRFAFTSEGKPSFKSVAPASDCAACSGKGAIPNDEGELGPCPECEGEGRRNHYEREGYCGLAGKPGKEGG